MEALVNLLRKTGDEFQDSVDVSCVVYILVPCITQSATYFAKIVAFMT